MSTAAWAETENRSRPSRPRLPYLNVSSATSAQSMIRITDATTQANNTGLPTYTSAVPLDFGWGAGKSHTFAVYVTKAQVSQTNAVLLGKRATAGAVTDSQTFDKLSALLDQFHSEGFAFDRQHISRISADTLLAAKLMFDKMRGLVPPPKIAPDGEGGLVLAWQAPTTTLVVVSGWVLGVVTKAGTPEATYTDDVRYDGDSIPDMVLDAASAQ